MNPEIPVAIWAAIMTTVFLNNDLAIDSLSTFIPARPLFVSPGLFTLRPKAPLPRLPVPFPARDHRLMP